MRGDFSQLYDDDNLVACVLQQQAQIITDANLNQQSLRFSQRLSQLIADLEAAIKTSDGPFREKVTKVGEQIALPKSAYVHGTRVSLERDGKAATLSLEELNFHLEGDRTKKLADGDYVLCLETQEYGASIEQDPRYTENAFPGIQPCVRLITRPILRVERDADFVESSAPPSTKLRFTPTQDVGNHLYRFEVHRGGPLNETTIKWSRDNASDIYSFEVPDKTNKDAKSYSLTLTPRDASRLSNLKKGHWLELLGPSVFTVFDSPMNPAVLAQISDDPKDSTDIKVPNTAIPSPFGSSGNPRIHSFVKWDHLDGTEIGIPITQFAPPQLDDKGIMPKAPSIPPGITITIEQASRFESGDYWVVPARSGDEYRKDPLEVTLRRTRHRKKLATFGIAGGKITIVSPTEATDAVPPKPEEKPADAPADAAPVAPVIAPVVTPPPGGGGACIVLPPPVELVANRLPIRDVPLKLLDLRVQSQPLRRWVASADLSEVAFLDAVQINEKIQRSIDIPTEQQGSFAADVESFVLQIERIVNELPLLKQSDWSSVA